MYKQYNNSAWFVQAISRQVHGITPLFMTAQHKFDIIEYKQFITMVAGADK
jgi:hypothetical protein